MVQNQVKDSQSPSSSAISPAKDYIANPNKDFSHKSNQYICICLFLLVVVVNFASTLNGPGPDWLPIPIRPPRLEGRQYTI